MSKKRPFIYVLADTVGNITQSGSMLQKARARSLVLWCLFALPLGVGSVLLGIEDGQLPVIIGAALGGLAMMGVLVSFRISQEIDLAGLFFVSAATLGLGLPQFFIEGYNLTPLILMTGLPVLFGLVVRWQLCLGYTFALSIFLLSLFVSKYFGGGIDKATATTIFSCSLTALATGVSTSAYSHMTAAAARKLKNQRNEIAKLANIDPLTSIPNRRAFNQDSTGHAQENRSLQIAILDLDNFKQLNDRYGHNIGDTVLVEASQRIARALPENAAIYRMGGDEFAVMFRDAVDLPIRVLEDIIASAKAPIETEIGEIPVEFSVGVSRAISHNVDIHKLYQEADIALFEAKQSHETSWRAFDDELDKLRVRRSQMAKQLKKALNELKLNVVFQPQFDIKKNTIVGFEALARWTDPEFGDVRPDEFIAIAEEEAMVQDLDRAVFASAVRQAEAWLAPHQKIAINISGKTLLSPGFDEFVSLTIARSELLSTQIQIEITETELLRNTASANTIAQYIADLGVSIALDDFGTGYSSLSYLSDLPIHRLKVDKSFIQACELKSNLTILKTIVSLARSLGLDLVIEGVEDRAQLSVVRMLGCSQVQGFFFSRPLTADQCMALDAETLVSKNRAVGTAA